MVKVAAVQMDVELAGEGRNRVEIARLADATDADLVVFPECANSGYGFRDAAAARPHAEPIPGPTTELLLPIARARKRCIVVGLLERDVGELWNAAALVTPDGGVHKYRKVHLPFVGVDRFVRGGDSFPVHDTPLGRVGMQICYDLRFPEGARSLALDGADIVVVPTNWPRGAEAMPDVLVAARAVENRVFVIAANRVGAEGGAPYIGRSSVVDPRGRVLAALAGEPGVAAAEIDPSLARQKRIVNAPGEYEIDLFADRHPEAYGRLTRPHPR